MTKWAVVMWIGLAAGALSAPAAAQQPPPRPGVPAYLILRPPARDPHGHPYYPGKGYEVRPQAYAYGWFGVSSRSHWKRQTGYHASYIQWSRQ
jgi:hypothetical protein